MSVWIGIGTVSILQWSINYPAIIFGIFGLTFDATPYVLLALAIAAYKLLPLT